MANERNGDVRPSLSRHVPFRADGCRCSCSTLGGSGILAFCGFPADWHDRKLQKVTSVQCCIDPRSNELKVFDIEEGSAMVLQRPLNLLTVEHTFHSTCKAHELKLEDFSLVINFDAWKISRENDTPEMSAEMEDRSQRDEADLANFFSQVQHMCKAAGSVLTCDTWKIVLQKFHAKRCFDRGVLSAEALERGILAIAMSPEKHTFGDQVVNGSPGASSTVYEVPETACDAGGLGARAAVVGAASGAAAAGGGVAGALGGLALTGAGAASSAAPLPLLGASGGAVAATGAAGSGAILVGAAAVACSVGGVLVVLTSAWLWSRYWTGSAIESELSCEPWELPEDVLPQVIRDETLEHGEKTELILNKRNMLCSCLQKHPSSGNTLLQHYLKVIVCGLVLVHEDPFIQEKAVEKKVSFSKYRILSMTPSSAERLQGVGRLGRDLFFIGRDKSTNADNLSRVHRELSDALDSDPRVFDTVNRCMGQDFPHTFSLVKEAQASLATLLEASGHQKTDWQNLFSKLRASVAQEVGCLLAKALWGAFARAPCV